MLDLLNKRNNFSSIIAEGKFTDTPIDRLNYGGNNILKCYLPPSGIIPNYSLAFLNKTQSVAERMSTSSSDNCLKTLLSFITDKDLLSNVPYSGLITNNDEAKVIDMKNNLNKFINWNVGRSIISEVEAKMISKFHIERVNELIDYVISTNIETPNEEFKNRLLAIFRNNSNGKVYTHSLYTLSLPGFLNHIALRNPGKTKLNSFSRMGYVSKSSLVFSGDSDAWTAIDKWVPKDSTVKFPFIAPRNIKIRNESTMVSSKYNFPFSKQSASNFIPVNIVSAPLISDESVNRWIPTNFSFTSHGGYEYISPIGLEYGKINNTNPNPTPIERIISADTGDFYVQKEFLPKCDPGQPAHTHVQSAS